MIEAIHLSSGVATRFNANDVIELTPSEMELVHGDSDAVLAFFFAQDLRSIFYMDANVQTIRDFDAKRREAEKWRKELFHHACSLGEPDNWEIWRGAINENSFCAFEQLSSRKDFVKHFEWCRQIWRFQKEDGRRKKS
jgi:hypothetical protein